MTDRTPAGEKDVRWPEVKSLLWAALDCQTEARSSFLDSACAGRPDLRAEIESLIRAHDAQGAFIEPPRFGAVSRLLQAHAPADALVGRRLGAYELRRLIGSGGMGMVYLAARADDQFQAQVAIKLIKCGVASDEAVRRFHCERQTLAQLNHPNIARLYDGGVTDEGLPYEVMEFVDGVPIDEYCDRRRLCTRDRLELFRTVCAAVQYAHQNLVVHRDLKPNNVLVTADGIPKLLDFGIAKIVDPQDDPAAAESAITRARPMTPEYASPEQVRGQLITTASDVYSLGVTLYQLLTGHTPYRVKSRVLYELEQAICEQEPDKPSTAIRRTVERATHEGTAVAAVTPELVSDTRDGRPDRLRRRLQGDVDAIVLMAMRKDPRQRYASVEQLSEDIRRHLRGLPVMARGQSIVYVGAKFVRRNKTAVAAAAAVLATLIGGIIGTTWAERVAARERDAAVAARQRADVEAESARVETRKAQQVTTFLQRIISAADPKNMGRDATILEVLDQAAQSVAAEFGQDREVEGAVHAAIGRTYMGLGRLEAAERHSRMALEIQEAIHGSTDHADVAQHLSDLGVALHAKGDDAEAGRLFQRALEMLRRLYGDRNADVATALNNLAVIARASGDLARTEKLLRQSLEIRRTIFGERHADVAESLNNLSVVMQVKGDLVQAAALSHQVLELRRELLGPRHPLVAQSLDNLGVVYASRDDLENAEPLYREALALYRELLGNDHPDVAVTLHNLATLLMSKREFAAAEPLFREALDIRRRALPDGHWRIAWSEHSLTRCEVELGRIDGVEPRLLACYSALKEALGERHETTVAAARTLSDYYRRVGKPDKSDEFRARASAASKPAKRD